MALSKTGRFLSKAEILGVGVISPFQRRAWRFAPPPLWRSPAADFLGFLGGHLRLKRLNDSCKGGPRSWQSASCSDAGDLQASERCKLSRKCRRLLNQGVLGHKGTELRRYGALDINKDFSTPPFNKYYLYPERNYIRPPPSPISDQRHFSGERGGGVYSEPPRGRYFIRPPLYTPPTPRRVFSGVGVYKIRPPIMNTLFLQN